MSRAQIVALTLVAALAVLVVFLALRGRQPPLLPTDRDHARFVDAFTCLRCHGPDSPHPQTPTHPLGNECLRCHGSR